MCGMKRMHRGFCAFLNISRSSENCPLTTLGFGTVHVGRARKILGRGRDEYLPSGREAAAPHFRAYSIRVSNSSTQCRK